MRRGAVSAVTPIGSVMARVGVPDPATWPTLSQIVAGLSVIALEQFEVARIHLV